MVQRRVRQRSSKVSASFSCGALRCEQNLNFLWTTAGRSRRCRDVFKLKIQGEKTEEVKVKLRAKRSLTIVVVHLIAYSR